MLPHYIVCCISNAYFAAISLSCSQVALHVPDWGVPPCQSKHGNASLSRHAYTSAFWRWICRVLGEERQRLSPRSAEELETAEQGVTALALVGEPWYGRLSPLVRHPRQLLESLIMGQQFDVAGRVLQALPELHDDDMLLHYAR